MLEFILIVIISAIVLAIYKYRKSKPNTNEKTANEIITAEQEQIFPYKKKNLFTKNEYRFYMQLIKVATEENMVVFPKVRLEDFIETTSADQKLKYRGYIKSRHVDFLICNKNLHIVAAVELDDPSHYNKKTRETSFLVRPPILLFYYPSTISISTEYAPKYSKSSCTEPAGISS